MAPTALRLQLIVVGKGRIGVRYFNFLFWPGRSKCRFRSRVPPRTSAFALPTMPATTGSKPASSRPSDMSVVLVTGSYDHEIRFWEAWSGICSRTIARSGESG
jgi:hypothetical protein